LRIDIISEYIHKREQENLFGDGKRSNWRNHEIKIKINPQSTFLSSLFFIVSQMQTLSFNDTQYAKRTLWDCHEITTKFHSYRSKK